MAVFHGEESCHIIYIPVNLSSEFLVQIPALLEKFILLQNIYLA